MKITIFGASGKTGQLLLNQALENGYQVTAYVRNADSIKVQHQNLRIVEGNLNNETKLHEAISGADACLSTLGGKSLTKHSHEIIAGIDRIVSLSEKLQVKQFIYLSSVGADESRFYMDQPIRFFVVDLFLRIPLADHTLNEKRIAKSSLKWTIVRPGGLTDGLLTKTVQHGHEKIALKGNPKISRANVAWFMLEQLKHGSSNCKEWLYEE
jgi:putative NADH-flavin reductase